MNKLKRLALFACSLLVMFSTVLSSFSATAAPQLTFGSSNKDNTGQFVYLSDYLSDNTVTLTKQSGWNTVLADQTGDGNNLSMRIEGQSMTFEKGIWAHATSTIVFDLSKISGYEKYTKFSAFVGLNTTSVSASSVEFTISTSNDNSTWTPIYDKKQFIGTADGEQVELELNGAKYLKLYAWDMGGNGSDHSIYADAKLITNDYEQPMKGPKLEDLDSYIRSKVHSSAPELTSDLKLAILQRTFVARFGEYTLAKYVYEHPANKDFIEKVLLLNKHNLLELYLMGQIPYGGYSKSMDVLCDLYNNVKSDLDNETNGDLYARLMISLSITHSTTIRSFIGDLDDKGKALPQDDPESPNVSKPLERYKIFKKLYLEGKLDSMFKEMPVALMNIIVDSTHGDDEYEWLNTYFNKQGTGYYNPKWIRYSFDWNYYQDQYHDPKLIKEQYQQKYDLPENLVNRSSLEKRYPAMWVLLADCGVCGSQGHFGKSLYNSIGKPAIYVGQPGHAALVVPSWNASTKKFGAWSIVNSLSPWIQTQGGTLLGWGRGYYAYSYNMCYLWLSTRAINDYDNYLKAEYYILLADVYGGIEYKDTRCELYHHALTIQSFNFDAMLKLTEEYKAAGDKEALKEHAKLIMNTYSQDNGFGTKDLLPLYDLMRLILPEFKDDVANLIELSKQQSTIFTEARNSNNFNLYYISKYLMGDFSSEEIASFSFDGEYAGQIRLGNVFTADNAPTWSYKIGDITTEVDQGQLSVQLTDQQVEDLYNAAANANITNGYTISIQFSGVSTPYDIKISNLTNTPLEIYGSDEEDRIYGYTEGARWYWSDLENHPWKDYTAETADEFLQLRKDKHCDFKHTNPDCMNNGGTVRCTGYDCVIYRDTATDRWKTFGEEMPDVSGDTTISVRRAPSGCSVYSTSRSLTFTKDTTPNTNKYISVDGLSVVDFSSETADNPAKSVIDGNSICYKSGKEGDTNFYDSSWTTTDTNGKYITIKLETPVFVSALEYIPAVYNYGYSHGVTKTGTMIDGYIETSEDGVHFEKVYEFKDLPYGNHDISANKTRHMLYIPEENQKKVSYVRLTATRTIDVLFRNNVDVQYPTSEAAPFSARTINLYQDSTKNEDLTAVISYSTESPTNQDVVAKLINLSTLEAEVIGEDTVTFKENGTHTFEFKDETSGKTGSLTAKVDWIDKEAPKAHLIYSTKEPTVESVSLELKVDEKYNEKNDLEMEVNGEWVSLTDIDKDLELDVTDTNRKYAVSPYQATMTENGTIDFTLRDNAGNYATYQANVSWIYNELPEVQIEYSTKNPTNGNVTATLKGVNAEVFPLEGESLTHVFTDNGDYVFNYQDKVGNIGTAVAQVDWIDRTPPAAHVVYSTESLTRHSVTATLVIDSSEPVVILGDGAKHIFEKNGSYVFKFRDAANNVSQAEASVTWITPNSGGSKSKPPKKPSGPG